MSELEQPKERETSLLDCNACNDKETIDHTCALRGLQDMFPKAR